MEPLKLCEVVNDESDNEVESPKGYYTRAKRRRLSENQDKEELYSTGLYRIPEVGKRKNPIMFVPTEVLQCIFRHIPYHELSFTLRLVNRRFKTVAEDLLNLGFKRIEKRLQSLLVCTDTSLGYTEDDMEIKCISKLLCLLEILISQYSIVMCTIWRYVYNIFYKTRNTCMYGGLLIDTHEVFIWKFLHCPNQLYAAAVVKDYTLPPEVTKIIQLTKTFCIHFDKTNEETMTNACVLSGCKNVDFLDCAKFAQKWTHYEHVSPGMFLAKYTYYFKNSWFVGMPIPPAKDMDWPQKQRMMHMRLRRIVLAHNDMFLQQEQYQREVMLRSAAPTPIKRPGNNVYTGYGDVEDIFYYYGVMNDGAYLSKFHSEDDNEEQDEEDQGNEIPGRNEQVFEVIQINSEEDVLYRLPYLGFKVDVTVRCPLAYAPLKYLKSLPQEQLSKVKRKMYTKGENQLEMVFECLGAHYARLPTRNQYVMVAKKT